MTDLSTRVFISSTGKDLADYRAAAIEICNRMNLIPIAMEFFEAMGLGATAGSKRKLEKSDVYVGIFAHRYGFIEDKHEKAVTEIEFDYADELNLDRLCFLIRPDYPWPPDLIDYENHDRLSTFKQKVNTSLIRAEFTTVDDFQVKLIQALTEWLKQHTTFDPRGKPLKEVPVVNLPPQPALFIGRDADIAHLKKRLGIPSNFDQNKQTIIRGWPGVGKTTLMISLAHDPEVNDVYPDGILWAALGDDGNALFELNNWGRQLGVPESARASTLEKAIGQLRALLQDKKMLLLVDDVWQTDAGSPFKQIRGSGCALIFTTRLGIVARELGLPGEVYLLGILEEDHGVEFLSRVAPTVTKSYPTELRRLVQNLEGLPLAIRLAGRLLESEIDLGRDIRDLTEELSENHRLLDEVAPDDRFDPKTGTTPTFGLLLKRSTDHLDETTRNRFSMLGAFAPQPATFDQEAMGFIWEIDDPLPTVRVLVDRGLLEPIVAKGRFQMHKTLVMHARNLLLAQG